MSSTTPTFLAFDLGGTKMFAAAVTSKGQILSLKRELVEKQKGVDAVIDQMARLGMEILKEYPHIQRGAIASAGPLDPQSGELLDPTNLVTDGKSWGVVPLVDRLTEKLNIPLRLENDAAAAALFCHWLAEGQDVRNMVMMTLGTGVGVGVIANGDLLRSGRYLHPEAGHILLNCTDETAPCGCGNNGCIEAYLSGVGFCTRLGKKLGMEYVKGQKAMEMAEQGDGKVKEAFDEYAYLMAQAITCYVVLFSPEKLVFAGGFSASHPHWLEKTRGHLKKTLERRRQGHDLMPELIVAQENEHMVLLGAARVAFY